MCKKRFKRKEHYRSLGHTRCHYCCRKLSKDPKSEYYPTVEHIVPKSAGGTLRVENVLIVCAHCNGKRGNKDFVGFVTGSRFPRREWLLSKYELARTSIRGEA